MKQDKSEEKKSEKTVEVLYQKMGDRWFAFSLVDDEVFVGSISQEQIDEAEGLAMPKGSKRTGNA